MLVFVHVQAACAYGVMALAWDRRVLWIAVPALVGAVAIVLAPAYALILACVVVVLSDVGWAWSYRRSAEP